MRCPDFSVIQINEKKLLYFQSTMFTEYPPAAELCKDRDKIRDAKKCEHDTSQKSRCSVHLKNREIKMIDLCETINSSEA